MGNLIVKADAVDLSFAKRRRVFGRERFQVLSNVSFTLNRGETLGVVGRNGCGKSSLLRLLAGIYQPDSGVLIRRCASVSLLSLTLGFDQNLSGRDNALISGMLMGNSRKEVIRKLGDIINFSELGAFIDEPLRTYSAGMRARLGFSVAVTMDAELLLIDEVLGVGDEQFRSKAMHTMTERVTSNQSVVFVSHSKYQVDALCDKVLWLEKGKVMEFGDTYTVLDNYHSFIDQSKNLVV